MALGRARFAPFFCRGARVAIAPVQSGRRGCPIQWRGGKHSVVVDVAAVVDSLVGVGGGVGVRKIKIKLKSG